MLMATGIGFALLGCGPKVDCQVPQKVSYALEVAPVIEANCFTCHAPDVYKKKASRVKLYDYEHLREKAESGLLMGSVKHEKGFIAMPYKKGVKIDTCDIALLQAWVDQGMQP